MPRHFRIDELLSPEDLEALKEFVREKNLTRTQEECHTWVMAKGYRISSGAVWNWLDSFRMEEKTRRAAEISSTYLAAASEADPTAVAQAAIRKFQELVLDYVVRAEDADAGELMKIAIAMKTGLGAQQSAIEIKGNFEKKGKQMVETGKISQAVLDEMAKAAFG